MHDNPYTDTESWEWYVENKRIHCWMAFVNGPGARSVHPFDSYNLCKQLVEGTYTFPHTHADIVQAKKQWAAWLPVWAAVRLTL